MPRDPARAAACLAAVQAAAAPWAATDPAYGLARPLPQAAAAGAHAAHGLARGASSPARAARGRARSARGRALGA